VLVRLEEVDAAEGVASGGKAMRAETQLGLFGGAVDIPRVAGTPPSAREPEPELEAARQLWTELGGLNVNELTPLQALNLLEELQQELKENKQ
jgi:hypothetical protein